MSENQVSESPEEALPRIDESEIQQVLDQMRSGQNLGVGIIAGLFGSVIGAGIWAGITVLTHFQIGWMAVGVGFLVGVAIKKFGNGIDKSFGYVGAALALFGCALGNLLAVCGEIAIEYEMGYFDVLSRLNPEIIKDLMVDTFSPMDIVFYIIALYEAYYLSFRRPTRREITALIRNRENGDE